MKEEEIDKYLGSMVTITDFEGDVFTGVLYKVKDFVVVDYPIGEDLCCIRRGYLVKGVYSNYVFRKSWIKKIVKGDTSNENYIK